jgi:hypothetical protein
MTKIFTKGKIGVFKDKLIKSNKIEVRASNIAGYGIFTIDTIEEGEIIEECIICNPSDKDYSNYDYLESINRFQQYTFDGDPHPLMITGLCGLFNHSSNHNTEIEQDLEYERVVRVVALKRISKNTELFFDYGWDPSEETLETNVDKSLNNI